MAARESAYVWAKNIHAFVFYISFSVMEILPAVSFRQNEYIFGGAKLPNNFWKFILSVYDWCLLKFKNDLVTRLRLNNHVKVPEATLKERIKLLKRDFNNSGGRADKTFAAFKSFVYNSKFIEGGGMLDSIHYYFINARDNMPNNDIKARVDDFIRNCYRLIKVFYKRGIQCRNL